MEKQTKNLITRKSVEKELRLQNTAALRSALVLTVALSLVIVPLAIGLAYGASTLFRNAVLKVLAAVFVGGLTSAPVWLGLLSVGASLWERGRLRNGQFDVTVCEVQYKHERVVRRHTEKVLRLYGFKETAVGNVNYDLVSQGDAFYVVHYKGDTTVRLLYSLKMYEYGEE